MLLRLILIAVLLVPLSSGWAFEYLDFNRPHWKVQPIPFKVNPAGLNYDAVKSAVEYWRAGSIPGTVIQFDITSDDTADPSALEDRKNSIGILTFVARPYEWAITFVDTDTLNDPSRILEADIALNSAAKWFGPATNVTWVYGPSNADSTPDPISRNLYDNADRLQVVAHCCVSA